jgi:glutaminyl-peptide cyclotransferase
MVVAARLASRLSVVPAALVAVLGASPAAAVPQETRGVRVIDRVAHDPEAFTQGLVVVQGRLYESTGLEGASTLRELDPGTGDVLRSVDLAPDLFGEGLAHVDGALVQLTWRDHVALVWNAADFVQTGTFDYGGEGWGLCFDGTRLVMSDGSSSLFFRDPATFALTGEVTVTRGGEPVVDLNELECKDGSVWANIWYSDEIVEVDPGSGEVLTVVDAAGLLEPAEAQAADVLNGIAWDPDRGHFWITGKNWPWMFLVDFAPQGGGESSTGGESEGDAETSGGGSTGGAGLESGSTAVTDGSGGGAGGGSEGSGVEGTDVSGAAASSAETSGSGLETEGETSGADQPPTTGCRCRAGPTGQGAWWPMGAGIWGFTRRRGRRVGA